MKFFRFISYFSQLRALIGFKAASAFTLAHLWNKLHPPREGTLAHVPVGTYVFYFPSLTYFEGLFTEIFFKETYYLTPTQESIRVIDCGANIGVSLLYIKIRAPHARVLCFEPNPAARAVLEKNIAENDWEKDVQVFPYALGKEKGTAEFFVEDANATSSGGSVANYLEKKGRVLTTYTVGVDTLSQYIDSAIDLLKIDIEGPEFDILEELIAQKKLQSVSCIQLEYHYIPGFFTRPLSEMLATLEKEGFRTFVQSIAQPHQILDTDTAHTYMIFGWRS
ncbi:MAG: FkbM family methyltransferase [Candidatus Kaiserbacteria bacterium]|nr:FkbM family methyltransferase [Candidatus Kaiserbacteria bacterium]